MPGLQQALSKCKMLDIPTFSIQTLSVLQNQVNIQAHQPDHFTEAQSLFLLTVSQHNLASQWIILLHTGLFYLLN